MTKHILFLLSAGGIEPAVFTAKKVYPWSWVSNVAYLPPRDSRENTDGFYHSIPGEHNLRSVSIWPSYFAALSLSRVAMSHMALLGLRPGVLPSRSSSKTVLTLPVWTSLVSLVQTGLHIIRPKLYYNPYYMCTILGKRRTQSCWPYNKIALSPELGSVLPASPLKK